MSASDSIGYFVELGEYNLIIARATLGPKPRTIEAIKEVWIGDPAGTDSTLNEIRPAGTSAKAIALLRLKARGTYLADPTQAKNVTSPDAVEGFLRTSLGAENMPANWAWLSAGNGLAPQGGARWVLDAAPSANTEETLGKIRGWTFELVRCQSAPLTLAGALSTAAKSDSVLLLEVSEHSTALIAVSGQGVSGLVSVPVGLDELAGSTQTALGLKFRGSAARLMFNDSYDFAEAAGNIVEPLVNAVRAALSNLGNPAPTKLVCGGILARQAWITQAIAKALNLTPFTLDAAAWASGRGLTFGSGLAPADIAPSWLGVLNAAAAHEIATPGGVRAWNPLLSNTPLAAAPIIPAIIQEPPKPATPPPAIIPAIIQEPPKPTTPPPAKPAIIPAIIQEPAKPAAPAKPAIIPAIIQEPAKPATPPPAPAKPATPAIQPKPAVIITPPAKPAETAKLATPPAKPATPPPAPAKSATTVTPPAVIKPAETKPGAPATPAKPATPSPAPSKPSPAPSAVKPPGKPEPTKSAPASKPAPAPVVAGSKPATAAPFPPKKNNMALIIGIAAAVIIGVVVFLVVSSNNRAKAEAAAKEEKIRQDNDAKFKALERARLEAEAKAKQEREASEKAQQEALLLLKKQQDDLIKQQAAERERFLYGRGNLVIATDPVGASVTVGELGTKPSPLTMKDMRLGPYTVTIALAGYDSETRTIEIKDKETTDLGTVVLKRQVGTIELNSEPSNLTYEVKPSGALFVNPSDVRTGQTPATLTGIPAGSYQVSITRPNWPAYTTNVTVERNGTAHVSGEFSGGSVVINSNPQGATVLRDNQIQVGTTPLTLNGIPPGNLSFTVTLRGCDPVTLTGKLEAGKTLNLNATMLDSDRVMKLSELDERPAAILMADPDTGSARSDDDSAVISLVLGKDGVPYELKIEQSSSPAFGKACLEAAKKWRFKPGVVRGKPARCRVTIPFKAQTKTE